jgi:hypothetical protein
MCINSTFNAFVKIEGLGVHKWFAAVDIEPGTVIASVNLKDSSVISSLCTANEKITSLDLDEMMKLALIASLKPGIRKLLLESEELSWTESKLENLDPCTGAWRIANEINDEIAQIFEIAINEKLIEDMQFEEFMEFYKQFEFRTIEVFRTEFPGVISVMLPWLLIPRHDPLPNLIAELDGNTVNFKSIGFIKVDSEMTLSFGRCLNNSELLTRRYLVLEENMYEN